MKTIIMKEQPQEEERQEQNQEQQSYGSIPYNIDNTYYLGETTLSPQQRRKKFLYSVLPLLMAVFIVGGAAAYLLRDFPHLYPTSPTSAGGLSSRSGNHDNDDRTTSTSTSTSTKTPNVVIPYKPSSSSSSLRHFPLATCDDNSKCAELGLLGLCCPTGAGVMLLCCDSF
jgi:hypothetical protein